MTQYNLQEVLEKDYTLFSGVNTDVSAHENIIEKMKNNESLHTEILKYRKDGTPFWSESIVQPLMDDKGIAIFYIMIITETTDRKKNESILHLQDLIHSQIDKGYALPIILQQICDVAESFFHKETCASILLKNDCNRLRFAAAKSLPNHFVNVMDNCEVGPSNGTAGTAVYRGEPVVVEDIETSSLWEDLKDIPLSYDLKSSWSVPIFNSELEVIGAFAFYSSKIQKPLESELSYIQQIAPLVSLAVKYSESQNEILRLAYMDNETGLYNRHYFINELKDFVET